jgi:hypothetical protein
MEAGPQPAKRGPLWPALGIALAIAASFIVIEGPKTLHDFREARRVERDDHVRGRVVGMRDTGDHIGEDPAMEVTVEFTTLDGRTVRARTIERVGDADATRLKNNPELDVWYDAKDVTDIVIRWRPRPP